MGAFVFEARERHESFPSTITFLALWIPACVHRKES